MRKLDLTTKSEFEVHPERRRKYCDVFIRSWMCQLGGSINVTLKAKEEIGAPGWSRVSVLFCLLWTAGGNTADSFSGDKSHNKSQKFQVPVRICRRSQPASSWSARWKPAVWRFWPSPSWPLTLLFYIQTLRWFSGTLNQTRTSIFSLITVF